MACCCSPGPWRWRIIYSRPGCNSRSCTTSSWLLHQPASWSGQSGTCTTSSWPLQQPAGWSGQSPCWSSTRLPALGWVGCYGAGPTSSADIQSSPTASISTCSTCSTTTGCYCCSPSTWGGSHRPCGQSACHEDAWESRFPTAGGTSDDLPITDPADVSRRSC